MIENPELAKPVEGYGDDLACRGCDFMIWAVEFNIEASVGVARDPQGEVKIQKWWM